MTPLSRHLDLISESLTLAALCTVAALRDTTEPGDARRELAALLVRIEGERAEIVRMSRKAGTL